MAYGVSEQSMAAVAAEPRLAGAERALLSLVAITSGLVALVALLAPDTASSLLGLSGTGNAYIYRLGGAAGLGYAVVLAIGIAQGEWRPLAIPVAATFVYGLASVLASGAALVAGNTMPALLAGATLSVIQTIIVGSILYVHRGTPRPGTDLGVATWVKRLVQLATVLALTFGILPLFAPGIFSTIFARQGTDALVAGLAAAACLGYGVMGILELRSLRWVEMRLPTLMAAIFNGLSVVASIIAIASGDPGWLAYPVIAAAALVSGGSIVALQRNGQ